MDNREATFILSAYRPGGQDANDPRFSEALEQARRDPILERWFRASVAFDAVIMEKLRAVEAPRHLRKSILAGAKVSRPLPQPKPFLKWAVAAAVITTATVGALIWHNARPTPLAGWQSEALDVISSLVKNESSFDAQSRTPTELLAWLRENDAPAAQKLPDNLSKLASIGCKTYSWNGIPLSVICFMRPDGGLIHLVTMNSSVDTSDRAPRRLAKLTCRGDWVTATWRDGGTICMLALEGSREQLRAYLL
jgi:hypothetical protein